jgi:hypothetical protein
MSWSIKGVCIVIWLQVLVCFHCGGASLFRFPIAETTPHEALLRRFVNMKAPFANHTTVWYHTGSIQNPSNGHVVAGIEGLEITRKLNATAYVSRKQFSYVHAGNRTQPLSRFRIQQVSPERLLSASNKSYQEIVHFYPVGNSSSRSPLSDGGVALRCDIEFPGGRRLYSKQCDLQALSSYSSSSSSSFTSGTGQELVLSASIAAHRRGVVGRWLGFGSPAKYQARSHEVYHFKAQRNFPKLSLELWNELSKKLPNLRESLPRHDVRVRYQRFGEGPSWLLPNRPFLIELQSFRLQSIRDIPEHVVQLFNDEDEGVLSEVWSQECLSEKWNDPLSRFVPWYKKLFLSSLSSNPTVK